MRISYFYYELEVHLAAFQAETKPWPIGGGGYKYQDRFPW